MSVCAYGCLYFMCVRVWAHVIVCASVHKVSVCVYVSVWHMCLYTNLFVYVEKEVLIQVFIYNNNI